jgi:ATP-binding cassette subfamily A (ABC1) protein 3
LDADVRVEAKRVESTHISKLDDPLIIRNLTKKYRRRGRKYTAVKNLSVGVGQAECFGYFFLSRTCKLSKLKFLIFRILGLNGAGKTTLIKMLIGELGPTDGEIIINGINMQKDFSKARRHLGYCPQFSYLPEFLIVEECLELFADLKGIYSSIKFIIVEDLIRLFRLEEFRKKIVKHLRLAQKVQNY